MKEIFERRSIRNYTGEMISDEELSLILKAGYAAPIGRGKYEDMAITVITNKELLNEINETGKAFFRNPEMNPLYDAPCLILVSSKLSGRPVDNIPYSNGACVVENMALMATKLGIGSCHIWGATIAVSHVNELIAKLGLPEDYTPMCGIILGKTNEVYSEREVADNRIATNFIK